MASPTRYRAARTMSLSSLNPPLVINEGDVVILWDNGTVSVGTQTVYYPTIKNAVWANWLVPVDGEDLLAGSVPLNEVV